MQSKRQRLINMRECLRQVQKRLPLGKLNQENSSFICNNLWHTSCSLSTQQDVRLLISRALVPFATFDDWMEANNKHRRFTYEQMMEYRQRWINQLCSDISREIYMSTGAQRQVIVPNPPV